jgi:hypothetical protein
MSLEKISELIKVARAECPEYDAAVKDDPISAFLSLEAANKITPLDLDRMIDNPSAALHDLFGIGIHLNPETKKFDDCFHPRFAKSLTVRVRLTKLWDHTASRRVEIDPERVWIKLGYSLEEVIENDMDVMDYVEDFLQKIDEEYGRHWLGLDLEDFKDQLKEDFQTDLDEICWDNADFTVEKI